MGRYRLGRDVKKQSKANRREEEEGKKEKEQLQDTNEDWRGK